MPIYSVSIPYGIIRNPYVSPEKAGRTVRSRAHKELARQVARKGVVLLKNEGILPLSKQLKSIAVIGPNADNMYNQLGDYTAPQERKEITTVLARHTKYRLSFHTGDLCQRMCYS